MRVLVCGGRDFKDRRELWHWLNMIHETYGITSIVEGGAKGADAIARAWGGTNGISVLTFEANWSKYGRKAGPIRNQQMLDEAHPELVVATAGGVGTADMVKKARQAGVPVLRVCM
jgi:SLOG family YspA-like protein